MSILVFCFKPTSCPPPRVAMTTMTYTYEGSAIELLVCEDVTTANGSILFLPAATGVVYHGFPMTLTKNVVPNTVDNDDQYLNWTKAEVLSNSTDLLGNSLLGIHGFPKRTSEPSMVEVWHFTLPLNLHNLQPFPVPLSRTLARTLSFFSGQNTTRNFISCLQRLKSPLSSIR